MTLSDTPVTFLSSSVGAALIGAVVGGLLTSTAALLGIWLNNKHSTKFINYAAVSAVLAEIRMNQELANDAQLLSHNQLSPFVMETWQSHKDVLLYLSDEAKSNIMKGYGELVFANAIAAATSNPAIASDGTLKAPYKARIDKMKEHFLRADPLLAKWLEKNKAC